MNAGSDATAPRKHDPRKFGRLLRFGHADTKTLDHEPVDLGQITVERRGFGEFGLERRRAERRVWRPILGSCRVWRGAAVFLPLAGAGLALAPDCMRANTG
jgi:hypothetical protein